MPRSLCGASVSTEEAAADAMTGAPAAPDRPRWSLRSVLLVLLVGVILIDVLAFALVPPFPAGGQPGDTCSFPVCYINGTLEFPPPHVVFDLAPGTPMPEGGLVITWHASITSTIITMWLVAILLLLGIILMSRGGPGVPGRFQNFAEWVWESLEGFGTSLGGPTSRRYIPLFVLFFLLILGCNWSGLIPIVGKVEFLRAPTSDVNITIGLALVAFGIFEFEGFRRLGVGGYLSKFFPFYEFKTSISAGLIALFVGLVELMLEFVKPLTLSMRLFGNIYGGEVALAVMTSLTLVALPVALLGLEFMLNFIQALIFSILTLMFIVLAIESHDHEEGEFAGEAVESLEGHPTAHPAPAH
jgi:F-type H+-transporting ATPase subunit a